MIAGSGYSEHPRGSSGYRERLPIRCGRNQIGHLLRRVYRYHLPVITQDLKGAFWVIMP